MCHAHAAAAGPRLFEEFDEQNAKLLIFGAMTRRGHSRMNLGKSNVWESGTVEPLAAAAAAAGIQCPTGSGTRAKAARVAAAAQLPDCPAAATTLAKSASAKSAQGWKLESSAAAARDQKQLRRLSKARLLEVCVTHRVPGIEYLHQQGPSGIAHAIVATGGDALAAALATPP